MKNRDRVWAAAKNKASSGGQFRRRSTGHQLLDPRYTVEGSHLPDKGLGNEKISFSNLYVLERTF